MLVLARRLNEAIRIGSDVEVRIVEIGEGYVRVGVSAPRSVPVHREEIFLAIQEANRAAAATAPTDIALAQQRLLRPQVSRTGSDNTFGSTNPGGERQVGPIGRAGDQGPFRR